MGGVPSTPRRAARLRSEAEGLLGVFVGEKPVPLSSSFWQELLELPLTVQWPQERVLGACQALAQNNYYTRHLAKIMIVLVLCLQELTAVGAATPTLYIKAINGAHISSIFLKYLIENAKSNNFEELYLIIEEEEMHKNFQNGQNVVAFIMKSLLSFISMSDISSDSCLLHHEVLNLMLVAMSTQLRAGPSPGPKDVHPFIDSATMQGNALIGSVIRKLLLTYITRPSVPFTSTDYLPISGGQSGVLQKVGSAAASFVLLPYYTFNYLVSSSGEGSRSSLADNSLFILLMLIHYRKRINMDNSSLEKIETANNANGFLKVDSYFDENPYCRALENARDVEFERVDVESDAQSGPVVRLPFASLFDTLGVYLFEESSVLLLYSLVHGNSNFLEYVLVRIDLDTLLMPVLEMLYDASKRTSNQIYMLLIILLILSQDSSFNASIHKLILPSVPWYKERLLHHTSLGSLMVVILIRTVKYNLSKLRDVYLHTNCLAILANMAPHVHRLSAYASQRLVSLFDMLSRKYMKLAESRNDKILKIEGDYVEGDGLSEDTSSELHIYTDFLRIVLEILNAILSYALPRNAEIVYAIMHRQEVFQPFKNHPRFSELLENIYTVLDFFNSRMDAQNMDGELSVEKVLQIIITNCRSWRGEGMKMFTQLKFTYEQEHNPDEFFIPYVWQLILSNSGIDFNPSAVHLIPVELPPEEAYAEDAATMTPEGEQIV